MKKDKIKSNIVTFNIVIFSYHYETKTNCDDWNWQKDNMEQHNLFEYS